MLLPAAHACRKLPGFGQKLLAHAQHRRRFCTRWFDPALPQKLQHRTCRDSKADLLNILSRELIDPYGINLGGHYAYDLAVFVQHGPPAVAWTNVGPDGESGWTIGASDPSHSTCGE